MTKKHTVNKKRKLTKGFRIQIIKKQRRKGASAIPTLGKRPPDTAKKVISAHPRTANSFKPMLSKKISFAISFLVQSKL